MSLGVVQRLDWQRKMLLVSAAAAAVTGPILIGAAYTPTTQAQSQALARREFEVASVKPNWSGGRTTRRIEPGRITYIDVTLGEFIRMAYGLSYHQISGPDWIVNVGSSDRYDVIATAAGPASKDEIMLMLRTLLVDRFQLAFHHENREVPTYALIVAKNGPKLKAGDGGARSTTPDGAEGLSFKNWTMSDFANSLSLMAVVGRPVLDRTGLRGSYSFSANLYDLSNEASGPDLKNAALNSDAIFSTLQEQLGLKLEPRKDLVEFLVIDHADKTPMAN